MYSGQPKTHLTRRNLLVGGVSLAALGVASMLPGCGSESANFIGDTSNNNNPPPPNPPAPAPVPPAFLQLPVLKASNGLLNTTLVHKFATNTIGVQAINTRTYNGMLGGPTLRVRPGDTLRVKLDNQLPANPDPMDPVTVLTMNTPHQFNTTNLHTHGLHVSPSGISDNIFARCDPGSTLQYEYQIPLNHPPGTYWYHPHRHGSSTEQLMSSMGGALIVEGGLDDVPEIAAARDLVYLISELNINANMPGTVPDFTGNVFPLAQRKLLVNGALLPNLAAFSGEVIRLRVINASVRVTIPFEIAGHMLNIISLDGLALPAVRQAASISLPPAGRADILVRCGAPNSYNIRKGDDNSQPFQQPDPAQTIGTLEVLTTVVSMALPAALPPQPLANILNPNGNSLPTRTLTFTNTSVDGTIPPAFGAPTGAQFTINQRHFNAMAMTDQVDMQTVTLGAVEQWTLVNATTNTHPFHIHVNPFEVVAVNGVGLPQSEWHDTFSIPPMGNVTIRHRFEDFKGMYVLHCHILNHEDLGMMQVVNVV